MEVLKRELGDDQYDNQFGKLVSRKPIAESNGYELYQVHDLRVRSFGKNRLLQPNNYTVRSSSSTIKQLSQSGYVVSEGQRLKHAHDGAVCTFHGYMDGSVLIPNMNLLGTVVFRVL